MKKVLLSFIGILFLGTAIHAMQLVPLSVCIEDPMPVGHGAAKSPDETPTVYIDDYTLLFEANHPEYVLNIKDEDGDVVYTTVVYSAQTQVVLPSTLSGDYVIELAVDNLLYTGWINL